MERELVNIEFDLNGDWKQNIFIKKIEKKTLQMKLKVNCDNAFLPTKFFMVKKRTVFENQSKVTSISS